MIEKIASSWKPFVKLTAVDFEWNEDDSWKVFDIGYVYMYANDKPTFVRNEKKGVTTIHMETSDIHVRETPEEIVAALSEMADDQRAKDAAKQEQFLMERVKMYEERAKANKEGAAE